jgi:hypothetical protein
MDWDEISNLYRGLSIDASYQVSVHLVEGFQRHISVIQFRYLYRDNSPQAILVSDWLIFKNLL